MVSNVQVSGFVKSSVTRSCVIATVWEVFVYLFIYFPYRVFFVSPNINAFGKSRHGKTPH